MTTPASTTAKPTKPVSRFGYPVRPIPGTDAFAECSYASYDRSVRTYNILAADGTRLGTVTSHTKRPFRSGGYHKGSGVYRIDIPHYGNLTEAALAFIAEAKA